MNILVRTVSMEQNGEPHFVRHRSSKLAYDRIEMRQSFFPIFNQVGSNLHRRSDAIGMRYRATIDPDERDVRATGSIYMSRLKQDQWKRQGS